jgi:hypothetical protein
MKKIEILNPFEIHMLLKAICDDPEEDKKFKEEWKKFPVMKRLYYRFQYLCTISGIGVKFNKHYVELPYVDSDLNDDNFQ